MNVESFSRETLLGFYYKMVLIRQFDLKAVLLRQQGFIPGFIHPSEGEEATAVGACAALRPADVVVSNHRGHAHHLAKGGRPHTMMAELMAKVDGDCRGRGGSLHVADFGIGNIGANGIVGGGIPIAVGAGLAFHMAGEDRVAMAFFGDGASNQGTFHEAMNLAAVWKLPVVFFCENNHYGEGTAQSRHMAIRQISQRAAGYGIPGVTVDGMDVLAVHQAACEAVERARAGGGPTLVEGDNDRFCGAYEGDPQPYRTKEEIASSRLRDPILALRSRLLRDGRFTEEDFSSADAAVKSELEQAVSFAKHSPTPDPQDLYANVYMDTHDSMVF